MKMIKKIEVMKKQWFCLVLLLMFGSVLGQNFVKHQVIKGETLIQIAQKYQVTPHDIYELNPDSQNGIQPDQILVIPVKSTATGVQASSQSDLIHKVQAKETLYAILKQYAISEQELFQNNAFLQTSGLQPGQELVIKKGAKTATSKVNSKTALVHEVQPKETKFGIATKYGITVEELEKQNPEIVPSLPVGYKLSIDKSSVAKPVQTATATVSNAKNESKNTLDYVVNTGETMYSLTRQFGLTEAALIGLNPDLKEGVKEAMVLKVPATLSFSKETKNKSIPFSKTTSTQERKKLVLFLPFNLSKIQNDTVNTLSERLKKDKFLNMTLDFYSGAMMAVDSAKVLGLNLEVRILDSQESKSGTTAITTIQKNNFSDVDAVIGPFYQSNVEKVAKELEPLKIPVISPLSKDEGLSYSNLFQSTPQSDDIKNSMFQYMRSKNGTILVAIDTKKAALKQYIQSYQKDAKIIGLSEKGGFIADSIRKHFVKDKMNYVILASEKTGNVLSITSILKGLQKTYQVQLVLLEPNETLDYEEIPLSRLTDLKLMYPSITRVNESDTAKQFERSYKKKNKMYPSPYATRGFDVTFDTMMRLSQQGSFEQSVNETVSEQIENQFNYDQKISGGFVNKGVYILYYDSDLTIKTAQ
jgi:LysM repeat protein/ABC-type branched-subunit amino acid transport system substrate-binding protein